MKLFTPILLLLTFIFTASNTIAAVNIVECEDKEGNRSFQKTCPPGSKMVSKKKLSTGKNNKNSDGVNISATLYVVPDCDTCDEVIEFLQARNVTITKKIVDKDLKLQTELTELTGGLRVPTTTIGESVIIGYNRSELKTALKASGYQEEDDNS